MNTLAMPGQRSRQPTLVLGGRGFIGSQLVDALIQRGVRVRSFDHARIDPAMAQDGLELLQGDFADEACVMNAMAGCDICYHLISTTLPASSNVDPVHDIETNLVTTVKLLNLAIRAGVKKIIFSSSGGTVYGNPITTPIEEQHATDPLCSYGITKLAIEKYLELYRRLYGLEYVSLRLANPYGKGQPINGSQGAVAVFLGKVLRGETIDIWGDGSVVRDYVYITDVINALLAVRHYSGDQRTFNIGSGKGLSLNELLDAIRQVTGLTIHCRHLPARNVDASANILSIKLAEQCLAWSPQWSFEEGLALFVRWLHEQADVVAGQTPIP